MKVEQRTEIFVYIAFDGKEFDTEGACLDYEEHILLNKIKAISEQYCRININFDEVVIFHIFDESDVEAVKLLCKEYDMPFYYVGIGTYIYNKEKEGFCKYPENF